MIPVHSGEAQRRPVHMQRTQRTQHVVDVAHTRNERQRDEVGRHDVVRRQLEDLLRRRFVLDERELGQVDVDIVQAWIWSKPAAVVWSHARLARGGKPSSNHDPPSLNTLPIHRDAMSTTISGMPNVKSPVLSSRMTASEIVMRAMPPSTAAAPTREYLHTARVSRAASTVHDGQARCVQCGERVAETGILHSRSGPCKAAWPRHVEQLAHQPPVRRASQQ